MWVCRTGKMGTRTVAYEDGQIVLFRAIMDNELGEYLKKGLPDTSGVYNDRVARNEGRITGFVDEEVGKRLFHATKIKKFLEKVRGKFSERSDMPLVPLYLYGSTTAGQCPLCALERRLCMSKILLTLSYCFTGAHPEAV